MPLRSLARVVLVLAATVGVAAGTTGTAAAAPVAGGTTTLTTSSTLGTTLLRAGIVAYPTDGATGTVVSANPPRFRASFPISGGDVDFGLFTGTLEHRGTLVLKNLCAKRTVTLTTVRVNLIDFTVSTRVAGSAADLSTFTLGDVVVDSVTGTLTANEVRLTAEAATALNSALGTRVFTEGLLVGSLTSAVTFAPEASVA